MAAQVARRMFSTEEFHRMAQVGILAEDDRVELIEGEIIRMSPIGSRHAACVDRLTALFTRRFGRRAIVRVQSPIVLSRRSEPQPDVTVLRPRPDFYAEKHPGPGDVLLIGRAEPSRKGAPAFGWQTPRAEFRGSLVALR
jgi:Uma2 family endonuclease